MISYINKLPIIIFFTVAPLQAFGDTSSDNEGVPFNLYATCQNEPASVWGPCSGYIRWVSENLKRDGGFCIPDKVIK